MHTQFLNNLSGIPDRHRYWATSPVQAPQAHSVPRSSTSSGSSRTGSKCRSSRQPPIPDPRQTSLLQGHREESGISSFVQALSQRILRDLVPRALQFLLHRFLAVSTVMIQPSHISFSIGNVSAAPSSFPRSTTSILTSIGIVTVPNNFLRRFSLPILARWISGHELLITTPLTEPTGYPHPDLLFHTERECLTSLIPQAHCGVSFQPSSLLWIGISSRNSIIPLLFWCGILEVTKPALKYRACTSRFRIRFGCADVLHAIGQKHHRTPIMRSSPRSIPEDQKLIICKTPAQT